MPTHHFRGPMEMVCFVPLFDRDGSRGYISVPVSGDCDIAWHTHLYRPVEAPTPGRRAES